MNNRLLKKLRKEAFDNVKIHPIDFEESFASRFSEDTDVYIIPDNMGIYILKTFCKDDTDENAKIEDVVFFPDFLSGQYCSEYITLKKAREVIPVLRRMYITFHAEKLRKKVNERRYQKAYNDFKKKLKEI